MKSVHLVAGYDHYFTPKFHMKTELYYQYLFHVISARSNATSDLAAGTYSALNEFSFSFDQIPSLLGNQGKGRNYGVELTVEHFMAKGFYFLGSMSVFDSKYKSIDQQWRNTRFNSNFATNILVGKEFVINSIFKIVVDIKASYMKGNRYIPINESASMQNNEVVYDYQHVYDKQLQDYFRLDFRLGYKIQTKKVTQEIAFEVRNLKNRKNVFNYQYNVNTQRVETLYQNGILPMGLYRIYF